MTKQVSFNARLSDDPSKMDEIALLHKMFNSFKDTNTYLAQLFTPAFVDFVQGQIMNDFSPCLDEYIDTDRDEVAAAVADARHWQDMYDREVENHRNTATLWSQAQKKVVELRDEKNAHIERVMDARDEAVNTIIDLRGQLEINRDMYEEAVTTAKTRIEGLENEVNRLKAELYDRIVANETDFDDDLDTCPTCSTVCFVKDMIHTNDDDETLFCSVRCMELY